MYVRTYMLFTTGSAVLTHNSEAKVSKGRYVQVVNSRQLAVEVQPVTSVGCLEPMQRGPSPTALIPDEEEMRMNEDTMCEGGARRGRHMNVRMYPRPRNTHMYTQRHMHTHAHTHVPTLSMLPSILFISLLLSSHVLSVSTAHTANSSILWREQGDT